LRVWIGKIGTTDREDGGARPNAKDTSRALGSGRRVGVSVNSDRRDSAWDHLDIAYTTINLAFLKPGETAEQARALARTRAVAECFQCLTDGTPIERRSLALRTLAADVQERRGMWTHRNATLGPVLVRLAGSPVVLIAAIALGPITGVVLACAGMRWLALVATLTLVAALVWPIIRLRKNATTSGRVLTFTVCPDCNYMLGNLRSAIPPEHDARFWLGPEHCPECGSWWPMVPPPMVR